MPEGWFKELNGPVPREGPFLVAAPRRIVPPRVSFGDAVGIIHFCHAAGSPLGGEAWKTVTNKVIKDEHAC